MGITEPAPPNWLFTRRHQTLLALASVLLGVGAAGIAIAEGRLATGGPMQLTALGTLFLVNTALFWEKGLGRAFQRLGAALLIFNAACLAMFFGGYDLAPADWRAALVLVVLVAATGQSRTVGVLAAILGTAAYLLLRRLGSDEALSGESALLLRIVFFLIAGIFVGFLFEIQRRDQVAQRRLEEIRSKNRKLRRVNKALEAARLELERLALFDPLTGVLNRRGLERVLEEDQERARRGGTGLVTVLIDLDDFKSVNDVHGHGVGDALLQEVARALAGSVRRIDRVARVGGDEFLVVLPDTRVSEGVQIAEKIRLAVRASFVEPDGVCVRCAVSAGVAEVDVHTPCSLEEILSLTSLALKRSKHEGKNRVSLLRGGQAVLRDEHVLDETVRGLGAGHDLHAVAMPIVDLETGLPVAYEMLSRGPSGMFEGPKDFFGICLEHNLITQVDLHCLAECAAAAAHLDDGNDIHLNVFPATLLAIPPEHLLRVLGRSLPVGRLCLEISEQQLIGDPSSLKPALAVLRRAGVRIAVDDVGFGRSSLESVVELEPDVIKVDRRLVTGAGADPARRRSLARLVQVAEALEADVVAEGIETPVDLATAQDIGIGLGQGFLWGQPAEVVQEMAATTPELTT